MEQEAGNKANPKVDAFVSGAKTWQDEYRKLREILLDSPLEEDLKWGKPCYSLDGKNIVLMHGFKNYCALLFMKGALLRDPEGILVTQTENVQSARQIRFAHVREVEENASALKAYVENAIEVEKAGLTVDFKKTEEFSVPEELQTKLDEDPEFKAAFEALTPGRQRGYLLHFACAKQSKTRVSRIEKAMEKIFAGKGWNER